MTWVAAAIRALTARVGRGCGKLDLMRSLIWMGLLAAAGACGSVDKSDPDAAIDAPTVDTQTIDTPAIDGPGSPPSTLSITPVSDDV